MFVNRKLVSNMLIGGLVAFLGAPLCSVGVKAESRTLSNLERERAVLIDAIISENNNPSERQQKIVTCQRRLMDMERMVIRDDRLLGSDDPHVQRAFEQYDTTFLVHASSEANQDIVDFWLQQVNLDSEQILTSKKGKR